MASIEGYCTIYKQGANIMTDSATSENHRLEDVDWSLYDFVDLGSSKGGSLKHCMRRFSARRGIGIDLSAHKVATALAEGYETAQGDATELDLKGQVSFVSMLNFLEHMPNLNLVEKVIAAAARSARDFLYIRHPSFEGEEIAEQIGYRQYWWHWSGHTAHIRVADYCRIFERLGLGSYRIRYFDPVTQVNHYSVVPTSMDINTNERTSRALIKPDTPLPMTWWRRQDIFVQLRPYEPQEWLEITKDDVPTRHPSSAQINAGRQEAARG